jgi:hypothetical protein
VAQPKNCKIVIFEICQNNFLLKKERTKVGRILACVGSFPNWVKFCVDRVAQLELAITNDNFIISFLNNKEKGEKR